MKKILYTLIAGAMALASCSNNDDAIGIDPSNATTVFTLGVDDAITRATTTIAPARYVMEVWSEDGTTAENVFEDGTKNRAEITTGNSFTVVLDQTKAYTCLFWADDNTAYDATTLKAIALKAGQEVTEAYHAKATVPTGKNPAITVSLKRAVAKVTLTETGTLEAGKNLTATYAQLPQFSVLDGQAMGTPEDNTYTATLAADALTGQVAQFYLLATTEQSLTDFSFVYSDEAPKTVSNVPVQQNYVTNIKGSYSSLGSFTFEIKADDAWGTPDNEVTPEADNVYSNNTKAKDPEKGKGTADDPFLIASGANLKWMQSLSDDQSATKDKHFKLTTDIEVTADTWKPIGASNGAFCGHFDGDGHTITGKLTAADNDKSGFGFFGRVFSPGSVQNLTNAAEVYAPNVVSVGGIIASTSGGAQQVMITNCINTAKVTGKYDVAGIVCYYYYGNHAITSGDHLFMSGCTNSGEIIAMKSSPQDRSSAGGIVASLYLEPAQGVTNDQVIYVLKDCTNSGNVSAPIKADTYVGGIVGSPRITEGTLKIKDCTNKGIIKIGDTPATAAEGTPSTPVPGLIFGGQYMGYPGIAVIE